MDAHKLPQKGSGSFGLHTYYSRPKMNNREPNNALADNDVLTNLPHSRKKINLHDRIKHAI